MRENKFYLNHNQIINNSYKEVRRNLLEIVKLNQKLNENSFKMYVYSQFWSISLQSGTLQNFMYKIDNRDEVKVIIMSILDKGPYFYDKNNTLISSEPNVTSGCFPDKLLKICFLDKQPLILSLSGESVLCSERYKLKSSALELDVENIIGLQNLDRYFDRNQSFNNIFDVLHSFENSNLVILESARKSARSHNFIGRYSDVFLALKTLETVELPLLLESTNEERRKQIFFEECGFEISKESTTTMKHPRYLRERMFVVPQIGKVPFEWHIKIGNQIRIHYYFDRTSKKIYVGHCGKHLGVTSYRS